MSDLHKFLFDGMPVRGMLVRLTDGWKEVLQRRAASGGCPGTWRSSVWASARCGPLLLRTT